MISVQNVSKFFGPIKALQNITFEIKRGEVVGFLGPNGAGKTTMMRLITGFFPPSEGQVLIDGKDLCKSKSEIRRKIGYLPENNPLYRDMTAKDFLSYVAQLKGISFRTQKTAIQKTAEQCGVESVFNRLVGKLSKGYQQRLGLAQALLGDPELLILDEPTNGLDPKQIVEMRNLIQLLRHERTILLSTHILSEVQMTCERVLILNEGKMAADLELKSIEASLEDIFLKVVNKEVELCQK
ncbi:MAG: ABC transporter ATP-binding protein [Candidatus Omnitrophica bacterium]|nr:ABC transporter ATP-binding protein [Candidatus Omnitrophota bacterium]